MSDSVGRQQLGPVRTVLSVVWALMPLYTFGLLSPVPSIWAAIRLQKFWMWLISAGYGLIWFICWILIGSDAFSAAAGLSVALWLALAVGTTVHAFQLRESVFAQPAPEQQPTYTRGAMPPERGPDDVDHTCSRLQAEMDRLTAYLRTHPDAIPAECERLVDEVSDHARRVLASAAQDHRAGPELHSVQDILTEYLPVSISSYTRLPKEFATTRANAEGRTPADELELQLELIRDAAREAVDSLARGDSRRLHEQSAFLHSKFHKSELDLP